MFDWLRRIKQLRWHKIISQNTSAIPILDSHYMRHSDNAGFTRLALLEDENVRIAVYFYENDTLTPEDREKIQEIHREIRDRFHAIHPDKKFDKTFGPSGVTDPETGN